MPTTLIKNAQIAYPQEIVSSSILIKDDKIAAVDCPDSTTADNIYDAGGKFLLPGIVDDHVHLREPGSTYKEDLASGSRACAKGGVTTFMEMPNTTPTTTTCERLAQKLDLAASKSRVNFGFYIGATPNNLTELASATRTPGIKIFIGSSFGELLVDKQEDLERIFAGTTLPIAAHCEDEEKFQENLQRVAPQGNVADHSRVRNHEIALIATKRALDLAYRHEHRFHVLHVSTGAELPEIADHRNLITAEVCPHHLFFNVDDYERLDTKVQMNPSIKTAADNEQLWQGLLDGTLQVIATDHAPHTLKDKTEKSYPDSPSGLPSVENSLALLLNQVNLGKCTLQQVVQWMCDAPARTWDMVDKGRIAVGYDADLVLVDMNLEREIRDEDQVTKCGWSPWHGETLQGWPVRTWVLGRTVYADGQIDDSVRGREVQFDHARGGYWATS